MLHSLHIYTYTPTHAHTHTHTHTHTHIQTRTRIRTRAYVRTQAHTRTCAHAHTLAHTHWRTHAWWPSHNVCRCVCAWSDGPRTPYGVRCERVQQLRTRRAPDNDTRSPPTALPRRMRWCCRHTALIMQSVVQPKAVQLYTLTTTRGVVSVYNCTAFGCTTDYMMRAVCLQHQRIRRGSAVGGLRVSLSGARRVGSVHTLRGMHSRATTKHNPQPPDCECRPACMLHSLRLHTYTHIQTHTHTPPPHPGVGGPTQKQTPHPPPHARTRTNARTLPHTPPRTHAHTHTHA
jgi:hypothetical protein